MYAGVSVSASICFPMLYVYPYYILCCYPMLALCHISMLMSRIIFAYLCIYFIDTVYYMCIMLALYYYTIILSYITIYYIPT